MNNDGLVSLSDARDFVLQLDGPTATDPADYVLADPLRGGLLYDRWWEVTRVPAPTGNHPLYPPVGQQSGSTTFRCKECHGWDYNGRDGVYGSGSHFTDIKGVFGTALHAREMFDLLKADPNDTPNGHDMDAFGMTDRDIWDVVKMIREELVNTSDFIGPTAQFLGDPDIGFLWYENNCASCHGSDGTDLNFGTLLDPIYVGTIANENPWEFLQKVRFGHPASPMPAAERILWTDDQLRDVGAYAATLPQ
jgi:thiosulfate dehydrogenase